MADKQDHGLALQAGGIGDVSGREAKVLPGVVPADADHPDVGQSDPENLAPEDGYSSLKMLMARATAEASRAGADYDEARDELSGHHGQMDKRARTIEKQIEALEPEVDAILAGDAEGLDRSSALDLLKYVDLHEELRKTRMARRAAWPATQPAGEYQPGKELG